MSMAADVSKTRISTLTTTVVKATPGQFYGLIIGTKLATGVIEVYDAASVTGTPVLVITTPAAVLDDLDAVLLPHPIRMSVGITIRTTTAIQDFTVLWN